MIFENPELFWDEYRDIDPEESIFYTELHQKIRSGIPISREELCLYLPIEAKYCLCWVNAARAEKLVQPEKEAEYDEIISKYTDFTNTAIQAHRSAGNNDVLISFCDQMISRHSNSITKLEVTTPENPMISVHKNCAQSWYFTMEGLYLSDN